MRQYPPRTPRTAVANPTSWNGQRNRAEQARFRRALIQQAGGLYCQGPGPHQGQIQAHHDTPTTGRLLCQACHKAVDDHAR